ncbi:MAG: phosphodiester glycosidase family protein [Clostridia bacterium]|nr:phosphodiester glycosidase family protein [Clostridia bacterium]
MEKNLGRDEIIESYEQLMGVDQEGVAIENSNTLTPRQKAKPLTFLKWALIYFLSFIMALLLCLTGIIFIFEKGPSLSARNIFVTSVTQTSAAKFTAHMFLSDEEVSSILEENAVIDTGEVSDGDLITIGGGDEDYDLNALMIEDVSGATYKGKMMIVNDPSRVYVAAIPDFTVPRGQQVAQLVARENAIAGINGGGFEDIAGLGKGAKALGIVVSEGVWRNGGKTEVHQVIGFDSEDRLLVGKMTGQEAIDAGVRDAVAWGPVLIVNGEPMEVGDSGGGLNPRTAIGQRADGAVLLLVIDGRQTNSLGASYSDIIEIMMEYGAINAANLDGGTSSSMVYNGEIITNVCSLYGERPIPTCFIVRRVD